MKRILFKSIILGIVLNFFFAINIWADGFGNNNMQTAIEKFGANDVNASSSGTDLTGNPNATELPVSTDAEINTPVGPGWGILSCLGLAYGCYVFLKKRKQEN